MNLLIPILLAATIPLRNPFWPDGYKGKAEAILDEPKIAVKAQDEAQSEEDAKTSVNAETIAAAEEAADEQAETDRRWIAARGKLKIGGTMKTEDGRQSVTINGNIYRDGDVVILDVGESRFYWRVQGLTGNGTLKLRRLGIKDDSNEKGTKE